MRVAVVCPYAWDRVGGVQTHVRALARSLVRRGHELTILAPQVSGADIDFGPGIQIVGRAVSIPANGSVAPLAFGPVAASGVRKALESYRPDLVHLHEPLIPSLPLLALWNSELPSVGTFHAAAESSFGYWASRRVLAKAVERITIKTAVSEAARDLICRYFPGDYRLTPNGVETARFASGRAFDLGPQRRVLFFGRIEKRKGLEVLIEAMTFLRDLDVRLVVAGAGPEERSCKARARRLRIDAEFLGRVSETDVAGVYRAADLLCAPNLGGESFGIVLIEGMAAGLPIVCSDLPAFRAVVGDAAVRVPPDDPGALADGLRRVLADSQAAEGLKRLGSEVALRNDWSRLAGGVEDAYSLALERG